MADEQTIWQRLAEPFPEGSIKQRVMHINKKKGDDKKYPPGAKGMLADYIDARDVQERLDSVVGPADWEDNYSMLSDGSLLCTLTLYPAERIVSKRGVGYPNNPGAPSETEPYKAAESDALKRAAVKFGIGRHLYDRETVWVEVDEWGQPRKGSAPASRPTTPPKPADSSGGSSDEAPRCPKCNGPMKLREPKEGGKQFDPFWGCKAWKPDDEGCDGTRAVAPVPVEDEDQDQPPPPGDEMPNPPDDIPF